MTFPPRAPQSLTDRDDIVANDWAAYSALRDLVDHWARPAWPDGASAYYWLLDLGDQLSLRQYAHKLQEGLHDDPDLSLVPLDLLHMTMLRVGEVDAVRVRELAALAANADSRLAGTGAIRLVAVPLAGSPGAIRFSVTPWDRLLDVVERLGSAAEAVLGQTAVSQLRPHISIAYNGRPRAAQPLIETIHALRDPGASIELTVTRVRLVRLCRLGRQYSWTTKHTIGL
ncbi:2'-5' RNA ligase family protein [Longispora sp. NPDC051575]|uniref:2'-5' RNA ligase family protein n=1 Tax=Longispora sp. NPDC051575 TaxID=3154943 RepID=UPI003426D106